MTRDDIIRLARGVGIEFSPEWGTCYTGITQIERFAKAVYAAGAADEREACVRACEEDAFEDQFDGLGEAVKRIEARGEE